ncbi:hypothetical protein HG537_0D05060 [Torulaspora globosa]|uniref:AMP-dependent synthetase/ligase domain-containing protein n=1 Tax=Torulaspora globosa TaxID=48254 RepID=A0A7H9HTU2_9SACH|nr:hypothetical protein HG537_0D05060 [Torulaspora sp. CBS 2947]
METACTLTELVETDPRYRIVKEKLSCYQKGSDEYLAAFVDELPLTQYPTYGSFLKKQGVAVPGSQEDGYSPIFRSSLSPDRLISCVDAKLATLYDHFMFSVRRWPKNDCLGYRPFDNSTGKYLDYYQFLSYEEVERRSRHIGGGIMSLVNVKRKKPLNSNDFMVAILSYNRVEWMLVDLACQMYSLADTALYETLGAETSHYIMNLTESPVLLFAQINMRKVIDLLPRLEHVNTLICLEDLDDSELRLFSDALLPLSTNSKGETISLFSLKQVERIGMLNELPVIPPTPDSLYTVSFTSGTTGMPKGVEMTHGNAAAGVAFTFSAMAVPPGKKNKQLHNMCFLPLAHIFQRMLVSFALSVGMGLGFLHSPDPSVLIEDMRILKPDMVALVPRILTRMEAGIKNSLEQSYTKKAVADSILSSKKARLLAHNGEDDSLMNQLVYQKLLINKIRDSLGLTNGSYLVTGSAPISPATLVFLRTALDIGTRQGYGLTETFAGICMSEAYEKDPGTCGAIGCAVECRLKSVPEMGYDATDLKGELQLRGPQVFSNYYLRPDETAAVLDEKKWYSTGDIASFDDQGRLRVIDRVKNFFKLSQGEYIAPEKIENVYLSSCPLITQAFVYGDSFKSYLVGVIGVDLDAVRKALSPKYPSMKDLPAAQAIESLNINKDLKRHFLSILNKYAKNLQGFEKLHNVYVGLEPLKLEDEVITPTLKIKRANASKHFKSILYGLYDEGSLIKNGKL